LFTARIYVLIEEGANGTSTGVGVLAQELRLLFFTMTETERRILAAQGYVELALYTEAREELAALSEAAMERVDVQEILLLCLMAESRWADALALTLRLCEMEPEEPGGFIHAAFCLHELGRTDEAVDMLSRGPAALRSKPVFYYNMGCYHACLGDMEKALKLLRQSFEMDGSLRAVARKDPDLDVLRPALQKL
jgi:tetratricopeptide (TPR) repeat protein